MPGKTQLSLRHLASMSLDLQARRHMFAVGPPRSEITPVNAGEVSRMLSTSLRMDSSERFWMIRPSCSVMEQNVQPPKHPRMILTE